MRKSKIAAKVIVPILLVLFLVLWAVSGDKRTPEDFSVRGVDVSAYQGEIDWKELAGQGISFAFIKATEGTTHKDSFFKENIEEVSSTDIVPGAYHFLSFESDGKSQAENFIETVEKESILLPPVIDLELYGKFCDVPPSIETVRLILDEMVSALYEEYGRYPIIYTNRRAYLMYVAGRYENCDLWMCDVVKNPRISGPREWTFWQYSHSEKLSGYSGEEEFIDMNVFHGTREEFEDYIGGMSND